MASYDTYAWAGGVPAVVGIDVGDGAIEVAVVLSVWTGEREQDVELVLGDGRSLDKRPASIRRGDRVRLTAVVYSTRAPVRSVFGVDAECVWMRSASGWLTTSCEPSDAGRLLAELASAMRAAPSVEGVTALGLDPEGWDEQQMLSSMSQAAADAEPAQLMTRAQTWLECWESRRSTALGRRPSPMLELLAELGRAGGCVPRARLRQSRSAKSVADALALAELDGLLTFDAARVQLTALGSAVAKLLDARELEQLKEAI